eukprot:6176770-Pleurochrysis_carterae.AAC.2
MHHHVNLHLQLLCVDVTIRLAHGNICASFNQTCDSSIQRICICAVIPVVLDHTRADIMSAINRDQLNE